MMKRTKLRSKTTTTETPGELTRDRMYIMLMEYFNCSTSIVIPCNKEFVDFLIIPNSMVLYGIKVILSKQELLKHQRIIKPQWPIRDFWYVIPVELEADTLGWGLSKEGIILIVGNRCGVLKLATHQTDKMIRPSELFDIYKQNTQYILETMKKAYQN